MMVGGSSIVLYRINGLVPFSVLNFTFNFCKPGLIYSGFSTIKYNFSCVDFIPYVNVNSIFLELKHYFRDKHNEVSALDNQ